MLKILIRGNLFLPKKALKQIVVLRGQEEEVMSEDEEIDAQFLAERIAADEAKERRERRQQLLREVAAEDPTEHLMKAVDEIRARPTPRMLLWGQFEKKPRSHTDSSQEGVQFIKKLEGSC